MSHYKIIYNLFLKKINTSNTQDHFYWLVLIPSLKKDQNHLISKSINQLHPCNLIIMNRIYMCSICQKAWNWVL